MGSSFPLNLYPILDEYKELIQLARKYILSVNLVYTDTDSLMYEIIMRECPDSNAHDCQKVDCPKQKGYEFIFRNTPIKLLLDRSNFRFFFYVFLYFFKV